MATTTHASPIRPHSATVSAPAPVRSHRAISGVLIASGLAFGAALVLVFGWVGVVVAAVSLVLPLLLLWLSADVVREDELRP